MTESTASTATNEADASFAPTDVDALKAQLADAEQRANVFKDQVLRSRAEMDNVRRRTERELDTARKFALERFAGELLAVKDSLELGLAAAGAANVEPAKIREGMELTLRLLGSALEKEGVKEVDPLHQKFNADMHQAMSLQETSAVEPNTVVAVYQKGYCLFDRLLRPAMVVVAKAPTEDAAASSGGVDSER